MITSKTMKSLANGILALGLIISSTGVALAGPRVSPAAKTLATQQEPDIHTIKDAGLQFELPKGWKAETEDNGNVVVSFADGAVNITFLVEEAYKEVVVGIKSGLQKKLTELKSDGEMKEDTHNGMTHLSEAGTGMMDGAKISWSIDVLKATKNVTLLTFGVESVLQAHIDEYMKFVTSIKKI